MGRKPGGCVKTNAEGPTPNVQRRIERALGRTPLFDRLRKRKNRVHARRADSETFFVQQSSRSVSGMSRSWHAIGLRSGVDDFRSRQDTRRRGDHAMAARDEANAGILPSLARRARETFSG